MSVLPQAGDIVNAGRHHHLVVGRASGADIAYAHPLHSDDPTALVELREVDVSTVTPRSGQSLAIVEELAAGVRPSALAELHARVTALVRR